MFTEAEREAKRYLFEGQKIKFTLYDQGMKQKLKKTMFVCFQGIYVGLSGGYTQFVRSRQYEKTHEFDNTNPYPNDPSYYHDKLKLFQSVIGFGSKTAISLSSLALEPTTKAQIEREHIEQALYLVSNIGGKTKWDWIRKIHNEVLK